MSNQVQQSNPMENETATVADLIDQVSTCARSGDRKGELAAAYAIQRMFDETKTRAAAPEMVAELAQLRESNAELLAVAKAMIEYPGTLLFAIPPRIIDLARAAIAKAQEDVR